MDIPRSSEVGLARSAKRPNQYATFGVALALIGVPEISDGEPDTRSGGSRPTSRGFRRSSAHALAPIGRQGRGRPAKERTPWLFDERTLRRISQRC